MHPFMTPELVFDVGMNNGDDTAYYLSRGFRVVAVEANPRWVAFARQRYTDEVQNGRLAIEAFGVGPEEGEADFWVNQRHSEFSAFDYLMASKNETMPCTKIVVPCVRFERLLEKYGVPLYLKIDIEGADAACLKALHSSDLPNFVSVEAHSLDYLIRLRDLGYRRFKVVDQMRHNSPWPLFSNENVGGRLSNRILWYADRLSNRLLARPFAPGSSGPFGEETKGDWLSFDGAACEWLSLYVGHGRRGHLNPKSWFDFHAAL